MLMRPGRDNNPCVSKDSLPITNSSLTSSSQDASSQNGVDDRNLASRNSEVVGGPNHAASRNSSVIEHFSTDLFVCGQALPSTPSDPFYGQLSILPMNNQPQGHPMGPHEASRRVHYLMNRAPLTPLSLLSLTPLSLGDLGSEILPLHFCWTTKENLTLITEDGHANIVVDAR